MNTPSNTAILGELQTKDEGDNVSQSFNMARVGACVDAMHINEVGGLVPSSA